MEVFSDFFDFNGIEYQRVELFQPELDQFGRYDVARYLQDCEAYILIIDYLAFVALADWSVSRHNLLRFLQARNRVIVWNDRDSGLEFASYKKTVMELDSEIPPDSVFYISDAKFPTRYWTSNLLNSRIWYTPYNLYMRRAPRLHCSGIDKNAATFAFMVLTKLQTSTRPHRTVLHNQLRQRPALWAQGLCMFKRAQAHQTRPSDTSTDTWHGQLPSAQILAYEYPSVDLYRQCFSEVVCETFYKDAYLVSEKTVKAIVTKTPFLAVSTMGYLQYLRGLGFRTFDTLICEAYDQERRVQDRVTLLLAQLEDIVKNGAREFYLASQDILDHNQNRLAEIAGHWDLHTDDFISQCLDTVDQ